MGYRTHAGIFYSSVQNHKPAAADATRNTVHTGAPQSSNGSGKLTRLSYDHEYGYPV